MKTITYTVTDPQGLHARLAGTLVKRAKELGCKISLTKGDKTIDATKLFSVMGLGVKGGDAIVITLEGENETQAEQDMRAFLQKNL